MRPTSLLLKDLQSRLQSAFETFPLSLAGETVSPAIYIGFAPEKESINSPFISVRSLHGQLRDEPRAQHLVDGRIIDDNIGHRIYEVNIRFVCCAYVNDNTDIEAGYHEVLNMVERVIITLNNSLYLENNHWKFVEPVKWMSGKEVSHGVYEQGSQHPPHYFATIEATFISTAIERPTLVGMTDFIGGNKI